MPNARFLSELECAVLAARVARFRKGGGESRLQLETSSTGNVQFARNELRTSGDLSNSTVYVTRNVKGAEAVSYGNQIDDMSLLALVRRAEFFLRSELETGDIYLQDHTASAVLPAIDSAKGVELKDVQSLRANVIQASENAGAMPLANAPEPYVRPKLFFESTYRFDAASRAAAIEPLVDAARKAGMQAAGYIEAQAMGRAVMDTWGHHLYYPQTIAQYTVTVRSPDGSGSGWAGVNWNDWDRVDTKQLSAIALDKCLRSRNPVRLEPGRYTVILEPQAVHDLFHWVLNVMDRDSAEGSVGPFAKSSGVSRLGEKVFDDRITFSQDPMDPNYATMPFDMAGNAMHAVTWVKNGILQELPYYRDYAIRMLGKNTGLPNSYAYRLEGGATTLDEMVRTTTRGVYVTRFSQTVLRDVNSVLVSGYTRDGTWLVENGAISHPIKNFSFIDSPMFVLNKLDQIGAPQRVFSLSAGCPAAFVPPIKARDFNFQTLTDAI